MIRFAPILFVLGLLNGALGLAMAGVALYAFVIGGSEAPTFAGAAALTLFVSGALALANRQHKVELSTRQAFVLTASAWVTACAFCSLPFLLTPGIGFTDAFFETTSGLTTTGATVLVGLDAMPRAILFWRSLMQWMGGIGIIVVAIAVLPFLQVGGMQLFKTESSDRTEKLLPRPGQVATAIARIYLVLTAFCAFAYSLAGMSAFDAINHAFTTVATGGYSTHDASIAFFASPAIEWIATVFMALGALPFLLYLRAIHAGPGILIGDAQVRGFLGVCGAAITAVVIWLVAVDGFDAGTAVRLAAMNIVSVITTTGYASTDYAAWGPLPVAVVMVLLFWGGCSGSTSGGIKMFRFQIMAVATRAHLSRLLHAHAVAPRVYGTLRITDEILTSVAVFIGLYFATVAAIALTLAGFGLDFMTAFSGAVTAVGNVGPALGEVIGPTGNFSTLPDGAKWALALGMLLGRLELMTVMVLMLPRFWRG